MEKIITLKSQHEMLLRFDLEGLINAQPLQLEKLKKQLQYKIKVYPQVWLEILQWKDHDTQPIQPRLNDQWYFDIYSL